MEAMLHRHGAKPGAGKVKRASTTRFERSGKMAVVRGLEKMDWGGSFWTRQDSFMACFTEVLRCAGHDVTYAEVMGLSGAAFKLTTGDDNWCPSQAICDVGADCPNQALRAFGYSRETIDLNEEKNPGGTAKARKAIVESIDRGLPVMYMDGERSLVVGYREGGKTFICMPYAGNKDGYKEMPKLRGMIGDAWFVEVLRRDGKALVRRDAVWESLRTAVSLGRNPKLDEGLRGGLGAYETWIRKLKNPPEKANLHGHAYVTSILLTSRRAAADYLRQIAEEFDPDTAEHLWAAADRYERVSKRLWDNRGLMKHPWEKSWTSENRGKEAQMMLQNLTDERVAIAEIEQAFAAEGVKLVATTTGSAANERDGAELVWIPGGSFVMGADAKTEIPRLVEECKSYDPNASADWFKYESPRHEAKVAGFWMYAKQVTNAQFRGFVNANPEWSPERIDAKLHDGKYLKHWRERVDGVSDADHHPVAFVPWYAARAYAAWAGGRLPSEAEWEHAARAGKQLEYGTATGELAHNLANYHYFPPNGTKPVGSYPPNPFGLYDMSGNVLDWCNSQLKPYPFDATDGREDASAPGKRVCRGGSWGSGLPDMRAAFRIGQDPRACGPGHGFRVVQDAGSSVGGRRAQD